MSTIEDFENAPVGATATSPDGRQTYRRETKTQGGADWANDKGEARLWADADGLAHFKYTLDPAATDLTQADLQLQALTLWTVTDLVEAIAYGRVHIAPGHDPALTAPTSAREALDLAWNLSYPVKEGQHIPEGTRLLDRSGRNDLSAYSTRADFTINARESLTIRTRDPLPDPEPDWLDAPAVIATDDRERRGIFFPVVDRDEYWQSAQTGLHFHWRDLTNVNPLYPKEQEA